MRVEEMYLIYIEAIAHTEGVDAAKTVLNDFMNAYRYTDGSYSVRLQTSNHLKMPCCFRNVSNSGERDCCILIISVLRKLLSAPIRVPISWRVTALNSKYGFVAPWMDCYIPEYEKSSNPAVVLNPDPTSVVEAKSE